MFNGISRKMVIKCLIFIAELNVGIDSNVQDYLNLHDYVIIDYVIISHQILMDGYLAD